MYLVGGTSQSSSGVTTYSNKLVYIGTDNELYSNGKKVAHADDMVTTISASSTDAQYPSAKAVYTALSNALGSYVNDIAALIGGNA